MIHVFIINNYAGSKDLAKDLRTHLSGIEGLRYFVFNTVRAGFEKEIVKKIRRYFEGERLRFYCCGGSGTMRNMLNGLDDFSNVEVAFFPCGMTNDFLKALGGEEPFKNIDTLINGKTVPVDYIKTNYGVALNTVSVGFDSRTVELTAAYKVYDIFGNQVPYFMSLIKGVLFNRPKKVELTIDGEKMLINFTEIIFGNGCVFGGNLYFTNHADVTDGLASYMTITDTHGLNSLSIILKIMKKKIDRLGNNVKLGNCNSIEIRSMDGMPLFINFDGELVECGDSCRVEIVRKGLNFVVPKDFDVKEFTLN